MRESNKKRYIPNKLNRTNSAGLLFPRRLFYFRPWASTAKMGQQNPMIPISVPQVFSSMILSLKIAALRFALPQEVLKEESKKTEE